MFCNNIILSHQYFIDAKENNMHILYILLLLPSLLQSAAHEFEDAWGFSKYPVEKHRDEINQFTELPEQKVMNPFWLKIKESCCQEKKILTLIQILHKLPHNNYAARRYNVTAAVYAGIDVPKLQSMKKLCSYLLLSDTVRHGDYPLTELLLKHKAKAHEKNSSGLPVIYNAQTAQLAILLINFGALQASWSFVHASSSLLHQAMWRKYDPALIPLYKKCHIDPLRPNNRTGFTPLMELIELGIDDEDEIYDILELAKISLLFQDLPKEKVKTLITAKDTLGRTVFDFIESVHYPSQIKKIKLDILRNYLTDTLNSLDPIESKSKEKEKIVVQSLN
jgi:hypothetical protein